MRTTGQKYSRRQYPTPRILEGSRSNGSDHLEELGALLARYLNELRPRHRRLHGIGHREMGPRDAPQVVGSDLEQALLEALALLARETGDPVGRLTPALDVRR